MNQKPGPRANGEVCPMTDVVTSEPQVNQEAVQRGEEVVSWLYAQVKKGDMGDKNAEMRVTAVKQMVAQVADDEPSTLEAIVENMGRCERRWATRHPEGKSSTAQAYGSRARGTIRDYLRWKEAPEKYERRAPGPSKPAKAA